VRATRDLARTALTGDVWIDWDSPRDLIHDRNFQTIETVALRDSDNALIAYVPAEKVQAIEALLNFALNNVPPES
jgi:hypothetical protein